MSSSEQQVVQDELDLFEGAGEPGRGLRRKTSRRLSSEDVESLRDGDDKYNKERRSKRPSQLSKILQAGSFRSSLERIDNNNITDHNDNNIKQQLQQQQQPQDVTQETTKEDQDEQGSIQAASEQKDFVEKVDPSSSSSKILENNENGSHGRHIYWKEVVNVHLHEMILGYNIGVSCGVPVELSWTKLLDEDSGLHERVSKTMKELRIPSRKRFDLCREAGATGVAIMSRIEAVDIMRQQLVASVKKAKMEDMKALKQAQKAAAKKKKKQQQQSKAGNNNGNTGGGGHPSEEGGCCTIQ